MTHLDPTSPAGGDFGPFVGGWKPNSSLEAQPITLDEDGTEVIAVSATDDPRNRQVLAISRIRNAASFSEPAELSPRGGRQSLGRPTVSVDRFGNGIVVWSAGSRTHPSPLQTAAYSTRAPVVSAFRTSATAFSFQRAYRLKVWKSQLRTVWHCWRT